MVKCHRDILRAVDIKTNTASSSVVRLKGKSLVFTSQKEIRDMQYKEIMGPLLLLREVYCASLSLFICEFKFFLISYSIIINLFMVLSRKKVYVEYLTLKERFNCKSVQLSMLLSREYVVFQSLDV